MLMTDGRNMSEINVGKTLKADTRDALEVTVNFEKLSVHES